jgi:oxygen-dependent protoporphyrinogen oxidase
VEPLLGGVYAGNSYRISMRVAVPQLFETAAHGGRSLIEGVRQAQRDQAQRTAAAGAPQDSPVFMGIRGGVGRLPLAVAEACRAAGAEIRDRTAVRELKRTARGWQAVVDGPDGRAVLEADAVVLAVPAPVTSRLLSAESPTAAAELATVEYASMALVTMAFRSRDLLHLPHSSGFLVPPVDGRTIKASTFSSRKWGWIRDAGPDTVVLRTSIGRHGEEQDLAREDTDLIRLSRQDLESAIGLTAAPVAARVMRWDGGLPQYPVGHLERVARIREHVTKLPGLAVCGAAYDGVGIPACIAGARGAARQVWGQLSTPERTAAGGERE